MTSFTEAVHTSHRNSELTFHTVKNAARIAVVPRLNPQHNTTRGASNEYGVRDHCELLILFSFVVQMQNPPPNAPNIPECLRTKQASDVLRPQQPKDVVFSTRESPRVRWLWKTIGFSTQGPPAWTPLFFQNFVDKKTTKSKTKKSTFL